MTAVTKNPKIDVHELSGKIESPDQVFLLDVRTPGEYGQVHIPGAVNIPLPDLLPRIEDVRREANGREIICVCASGNRASRAAEILNANGLHGVVLDGGTNAYSANYEVNRGAPAISLERQVRIVAGGMAGLGSVLGFTVWTGFHAIPLLIGFGLMIAGITGQCGMALVLARMPWNRGLQGASCSN